ncbi:MAG: iron-sulfur cluster assembly accessory protein [Ghiorsea sp.]|nr:iron-sulfur cluster assembly accessory protein [Ghiorsea sp.]
MKQADINLTPAAISQFAKKLNEAHKQAVRLSLREAGCSGLEYVLDFEDKAETGDLAAEFDGLTIYIAEQFYDEAIKGLEIDYQEDMLSSSFVFKNPNKKGECGCGKSFTA